MQVGACATPFVDEDEITSYFAAMLLAGSLAVATTEVGAAFGVSALTTVSTALIFGSALLVSGAILLVAVRELRAARGAARCQFVMP